MTTDTLAKKYFANDPQKIHAFNKDVKLLLSQDRSRIIKDVINIFVHKNKLWTSKEIITILMIKLGDVSLPSICSLKMPKIIGKVPIEIPKQCHTN